MKHVIIGTAGHVDHGKTMLIKALTGIDTDRLIEEKKRGITIELGFAHIEFDDHTQAGIIDVPGHEKFIKNMLAGAGGIDLAMLVVAADEGFMPQTVEHLDILTLLGIRDGVVVITKTDMVDEEWVEIVREDIAAHVKGTFLEGKPVLPVSAYTGQGIPELKKELQQRVSRVAVRNEQIPFRLPVDRVFSKDGFGTVVTGTMIEGNLSVGDPVELMPSGQRAKVRTLQVHNHSVEQAYAGQRVAVNLAGLRRDAVVRGDTLCAPDRSEGFPPHHRERLPGTLLPRGCRPHRQGGAAGAGYAGAGSVRLCPTALYGAGGGEAGGPLRHPVLLPHGDHRRRRHPG